MERYLESALGRLARGYMTFGDVSGSVQVANEERRAVRSNRDGSKRTAQAVSSSSTPLFVLTPTRDRCQLLVRAIESVRNQSYPNWHHYIIDDGSCDGTAALIEKLKEEPRVHAYRFDSNRGVNRARNFLLERILERREPGFIALLDDDDVFEKDALNRFAAAIREQPDAGWFIASCYYPNGQPLSRIRSKGRPLCFVRDHKLGNRIQGDVAHVFSTEIVGETRFSQRFANAEEWWFFGGLARQSKMFVLDFHAKTQEYLEGGLTRIQPNKHRAAEVFAQKLECFDPFLNRSQRAMLEARCARHLFAGGERRSGLRRFGRAFMQSPFEYRIYVYLLEIVSRLLLRGFRPAPSGAVPETTDADS